MTTQTLVAPERPLPPLPRGVKGSDVWRDAKGNLVQGSYELPVDANKKIIGRLFACPDKTCAVASWAIEPAEHPEQAFCPGHGIKLVFLPLDDAQQDPVAAGRSKQLARFTQVYSDRKAAAAKAISAAASQRAERARQVTAEGVAQLGSDMRGHAPTIAASAAVAIGVVYTVDHSTWQQALAVDALFTWGAIAAYGLAVLAQKVMLERRNERFEGKARDDARGRALHLGAGVAAAGLYLGAVELLDAIAGMDLSTPWQAAVVTGLGALLAWVVNKSHWEQLWAARRRLREMEEASRRALEEAKARRLAEEAERLRREAEERLRLAEYGVSMWDENNPEHWGKRLAMEWEKIAKLESAQTGFSQIGRTWIEALQTKAITVPVGDDGLSRRTIGWEFVGKCQPGALVPRGEGVPLMNAKNWLCSVLFDGRYDASQLTLVDRPGGAANTFLVMITEHARLGEIVKWKGAAGIRVASDGSIYGHIGRALTGEDIEELIYEPGQPMGGATAGTIGGGKSAAVIIKLLNRLAACVLPFLHDPKSLADYADFVGIFPIGVTKEHRDMFLKSLRLERKRRERVAAGKKMVICANCRTLVEQRAGVWQHKPSADAGAACADPEPGRRVAGESVHHREDGDPIAAFWEEFHTNTEDEAFVHALTREVRLSRLSAEGHELITQGGGLADFVNSVLRGLLKMVSLTTFRMDDMQARMAGNRNQVYSTADLPNLPGMQLRQSPSAPPVPLRGAFVPRKVLAEGNVFETLWGPGTEKVLQFADPMQRLHPDTVALWETTGLMAFWRRSREPDGLEWLLAQAEAAADEDEDDQEGGHAVALPAPVSATTGQNLPAVKMLAEDVILALVLDEPTVGRAGIMAHECWNWLPGWGKTADPSTISKAARVLDPKPADVAAGAVQLLQRSADGKQWTVLPAGRERAEAALAQLKAAGAPLAGRPARTGGNGETLSPEQIENRVLLEEELRKIARDEARLERGARG